MNDAQHLTAAANRKSVQLLVSCGIAIAPVFLLLAAVQMMTRPGFDISRHAVSSLQNGDLGWVQSANFMFCGLLAILCAWGFRRLLGGSRGGTWGPLLIGVFGAGMILAGIFPPDPAFGFPDGAPHGAPEVMSVAGGLHSLGFFAAFLALIVGFLVLSRHFGKAMPGWRNVCFIVSITTPLLIILGTAAFPNSSGIFYFAAGAISFTWLSTVAWARRTNEPTSALNVAGMNSTQSPW